MAEARYDAVADFYATAFDELDDPASAALLDLLGPPAGLQVLDIACGHGRLTRELARRGAVVTGADISGALIGRARAAELAEPLGIRYLHADVAALRVAGSEGTGFDAVTCNFGLSDIDDLDGAVAAVSAALRPSGWFVFSILHPCFPGGPGVSAAWPPAGGYHGEGFWTADAELSPLRRQVGATHRMVSTYLNTLRRHGLWLDQMSEPAPTEQWTRGRLGTDRVPVYLAGRCLKAAVPA
ncbi:MAG: class I SAM-dependent methyltransferase [Streptosporangiaceae bacterium]